MLVAIVPEVYLHPLVYSRVHTPRGTPTHIHSLVLTVVPIPPVGMSMSRGSTARFGSSYYSVSGRPRAQAPSARGGLGPRSGTTRQAKRTGGWANPVSGGELKFKDTALTNTALGLAAATFTTPGPTFLLNGLVPDSTATGRIGRKIVLKSLLVRWSVSMAATSTLGAPIRVIVFYDKQANASAPAVTDVLVTDSFFAPNNLSNRDRFVTLSDQYSEPIGTSNGVYVCAGNIYKKNLNLETMYNAGTAGTIGDITSGSLYIMIAQEGRIATAAPLFSMYARIRYQD